MNSQLKRGSRVFALLCLTAFLTACGGKPFVVEIPKYVPRPAACGQIEAVDLPSGTSAERVIEVQHTAILRYEVKVAACYGEVSPAPSK